MLAYAASDWAPNHLWLVDERCVPEADPRLNFAMIRSALVDQVPIPLRRSSHACRHARR